MNDLIKHYQKSNQGMTLIEVIVSITIFSIVMLVAFTIFRFSTRSFAIGVNQYNAQSETRMISEYVLSSIRFSSDISIEMINTSLLDINTLDPKYNYIYFQNNKLHHLVSDNHMLSAREMGNDIQSAVFSIHDSNFALDILVNDDNQSFSIDADIDLPNIRITSADVTANTGNFVKYRNDTTINLANNNYLITVSEKPMYFIDGSLPRQIHYTIIPSLPDATVTYSSYDDSISSVDTLGIVTPLSVGSTVIRMQIEKNGIVMDVDIPVFVLSNSLYVAIAPAGPLDMASLSTIELDYSFSSLSPGESISNVKWTSSDPSVVTINQDGTVTAVATAVDLDVTVKVEITSNTGRYGMASITINVLPVIKLTSPIVEINSTGNNKGIFISDAYPGSTVTVFAKKSGDYMPYLVPTIIDEDGNAFYLYASSNDRYKFVLSYEGFWDSDPVYYDKFGNIVTE